MGSELIGPFDIARGLRFNASKLLLDPYARAISGELIWDESVYDYQRSRGDHLVRNLEDSCSSVPRAVVVDNAFDWQGVEPPRRPLADTIIYETHVKGATKLHPDVPEPMRGTYAGLAHPAMLEHFRSLGITAVELLPVHEFIDDEFLVEKGLVNYWGYNSIGFLRADGPLCHGGRRWRTGSRVQRDGAQSAPCGNRGHSRCRVQPHCRRRQRRPDVVIPGAGQSNLLSPAARSS